jgi:hypothetical protein
MGRADLIRTGLAAEVYAPSLSTSPAMKSATVSSWASMITMRPPGLAGSSSLLLQAARRQARPQDQEICRMKR